MITWARGVTIIGTIALTAYLLMADEGNYVLVTWLAGGGLLALLNRFRERPEGNAFDRALVVQAVAFLVATFALFVVGVLALVGVIEVADGTPRAAVVFVGGAVAFGCGMMACYRVFQYFDAGGGGIEAVRIWRERGLQAMRQHNEAREDRR